MNETIRQIPPELLETLLDNPYECLILIDADGIIRFMNSFNEGIFPVTTKEAIGSNWPTTGPFS